jgi:hypothetical protein
LKFYDIVDLYDTYKDEDEKQEWRYIAFNGMESYGGFMAFYQGWMGCMKWKAYTVVLSVVGLGDIPPENNIVPPNSKLGQFPKFPKRRSVPGYV